MAPKKAGGGSLRASGSPIPSRSPSPKPKAKAGGDSLRVAATQNDQARSPSSASPRVSGTSFRPNSAPRSTGVTNGTDSSQPETVASTPSANLQSAVQKTMAVSTLTSKRPKFIRKAFPFTGSPGLKAGENARVNYLESGGQAEKHGIKIDWKIVEVGGESLKRIGDNEHTRYAKRINEALRVKSTYHGVYHVTFVFPAPAFDEEMVKEQEQKLGKLQEMTSQERSGNLSVLEKMNEAERNDLLQRPKACNGLLQSGFDELTVLFGEKTAAAMQENRSAMDDLQRGKSMDSERLAAIDFEYTDEVGNTPLHLAFRSKNAKNLIKAAKTATPNLLRKKNKRGERPLEAILKRAKAEERAALLEMYRELAPEALILTTADGTPLGLVLYGDERNYLPDNSIPWEDICTVLLAGDLPSMQRGYADLSRRICAVRSDLEPSDHVAVWTALISDHCFGSLAAAKTKSGDAAFAMSAQCEERLETVWKALNLLLKCSADESIEPGDDLPGMPNTALKGLARGVLGATMGPLQANFDPRETYRERIVELVDKLQLQTAARLKEVLDDRRAKEPDFARAVENDIPCNTLHHLVPSGAIVREAPERLRVDSQVKELTEEIAPVPTPEWVLSQQIDMGMVDTLKNADCIKKARDLCDLVETKSSALSPARLRFACLHVAWVWSFCGEHMRGVNSTIREKLGLNTSGEPDKFPCPGSGDFIIRSFRARSEPKGLPRLLEKTQEAIEEEVALGKSASILKLDVDTSVEPQDAKNEQLALLELLTPGCYVCDIVGAEVSVETFKGMLSLYKKLSSMTLAKDGLQVVRTKSGFSKDAPEAAGGYKDLKLWVMVAVEGRTVVAELQVHIHSILEQKKFMHLSYECFRGSFDHPHLQAKWLEKPKPKPPTPEPIPTEPVPEPPKGCCASLCASLSGKNSKVAPAS